MKAIYFQFPTMDRDTFYYPRLLQAPSSLALDTSRDAGAATAALGTPCQGLPTLTGKNFLLISNQSILSFNLKPFPLVLSHQALASFFL